MGEILYLFKAVLILAQYLNNCIQSLICFTR